MSIPIRQKRVLGLVSSEFSKGRKSSGFDPSILVYFPSLSIEKLTFHFARLLLMTYDQNASHAHSVMAGEQAPLYGLIFRFENFPSEP